MVEMKRRAFPIIALVVCLASTLPSVMGAPLAEAKEEVLGGQESLQGLQDVDTIGNELKLAGVPIEAEAHADTFEPPAPETFMPEESKVFAEDPLKGVDLKPTTTEERAAPTVVSGVSGRAQDFLEAFEELDKMADSDTDQDLVDEHDEEPLDVDFDSSSVGTIDPNDMLETTLKTDMKTKTNGYVPSEPISGGLVDPSLDTDAVVQQEAHEPSSPAAVVEQAETAGNAIATTEAASAPAPPPAAAKNAAAAKNDAAAAMKKAATAHTAALKSLASAKNEVKDVSQLTGQNSAVGPAHHIGYASMVVTILAAMAVRAI